VLQGLGYAFLLIGTAVSAVIIVGDVSAGENSFLPVQLFGLVILLTTWTFSALLIVIGSYVEFRADEQEIGSDAEPED